ncbi:MAG: peptidylprolyl isomerase [Bradymonadaceae bacterium]
MPNRLVTPLARSLICFGTALVLGGTFAVGCASKQKAPEKSSAEKHDYRSTGGQSSSKDQTSSSASSSSSSASGKSTDAGGKASPSAGKHSGSSQGGSKASIPKATGPIAHIDGEPIPAKAFNEEIQKVANTGRVPPRLLQKFKSRLVDRLIDKKLTERAIEQSSVKVSDQTVEKRFQELKKRFGGGSKGEAKLQKMREQFGITDADLKDSIRQSLAIKKLLVKRGMELPTKKEVKSYYEKNKSKFRRPAQVRARHLLVRVKRGAGQKVWKEKKKKVEKLRKKLTGGKTSFGAFAKKHSEGPSAKRGGKLGWVSKKKAAKMGGDFADAAFKLKKGTISKPVKSKYGWHLIKAVDRREAKTVPFSKAKKQLRRKLENRKVQSRLKKFTKKLRSKATIEKHPENIQ